MPDLQSSVDPHSIVRTHAAHQTIKVDVVSALLSYIGWAEPGTPTSEASWRIARATYDVSGNCTEVVWADGNSLYDNAWDNRAGLGYA